MFGEAFSMRSVPILQEESFVLASLKPVNSARERYQPARTGAVGHEHNATPLEAAI
jgi:hypothetical protein